MGRPTPVCASWRTMPAESTGIFRWSHRQVMKKQDFEQKSPFFPENAQKTVTDDETLTDFKIMSVLCAKYTRFYEFLIV